MRQHLGHRREAEEADRIAEFHGLVAATDVFRESEERPRVVAIDSVVSNRPFRSRNRRQFTVVHITAFHGEKTQLEAPRVLARIASVPFTLESSHDAEQGLDNDCVELLLLNETDVAGRCVAYAKRLIGSWAQYQPTDSE